LVFFHTFSVTGFLEIGQGYWKSLGSIPVGSTTCPHHGGITSEEASCVQGDEILLTISTRFNRLVLEARPFVGFLSPVNGGEDVDRERILTSTKSYPKRRYA
jgi:hypothetical protein